MNQYRLDELEVGERAARGDDDWGWEWMGPRDEVVATDLGLVVEHYCQHCGQRGGH